MLICYVPVSVINLIWIVCRHFETDEITNITSSYNTFHDYTHYHYNFPNDQIKFSRSGNYLLIVYDDNLDELILTQRIKINTANTIIQGNKRPRPLWPSVGSISVVYPAVLKLIQKSIGACVCPSCPSLDRTCPGINIYASHRQRHLSEHRWDSYIHK